MIWNIGFYRIQPPLCTFHNVLRGIAVTTCAGRTTLIDLGDFPSPFVFPIIGLQGGFEPPGVVYFIRRHTIAGTFAVFTNTKTKNNDYEYSITADSWPEGGGRNRTSLWTRASLTRDF